MNKKIFVAIASFRDLECQHTIQSLFSRAQHPEKIHVGLFWQGDEEEDQDCFEIPFMYPEQVKIKKIPYQEAKGVGTARIEAMKLIEDEEYTLQIDGHMRFVQDWDETLIQMHENLEAAGHSKPLISTYPPEYQIPDNLGNRLFFMLPEFDENVWRFSASPYNYVPEAPMPSASVSSGFIFLKSSGFKEVPNDPYLYFMGEEISLSVRFWTHGYDIFNPAKFIVYHLYTAVNDGTRTDGRVKETGVENPKSEHWDNLAIMRINYLLGVQNSITPEATQELDRYSLGTVRSLHEYQLFSGISFHNKTITDASSKGLVRDLWKDQNHKEKEFLVSDLPLEVPLKFIIKTFNIQSILDLKCGNADYARRFSEHFDIQFTGLDTDRVIIDWNRQRSSDFSHHIFSCLDCVKEPLPKADLLIHRGLGHLSPLSIFRLFANLHLTKAFYLLVPQGVLTHGPFYFKEPLLSVHTETGEVFDVWDFFSTKMFLCSNNARDAEVCSKLYMRLEAIFEQFERMFGSQPQYLKMLLQSYQESTEAVFKMFDDVGMQHLLKFYWQQGNINDVIRLNFATGFEKLSDNFAFIPKDLFEYASILTRSYIKMKHSAL